MASSPIHSTRSHGIRQTVCFPNGNQADTPVLQGTIRAVMTQPSHPQRNSRLSGVPRQVPPHRLMISMEHSSSLVMVCIGYHLPCPSVCTMGRKLAESQGGILSESATRTAEQARRDACQRTQCKEQSASAERENQAPVQAQSGSQRYRQRTDPQKQEGKQESETRFACAVPASDPLRTAPAESSKETARQSRPDRQFRN